MFLANKLSLFLLSLSSLLFLYGYMIYGKHDWIAAKEPINISEVGSLIIEFQSQMNSFYELRIETDRVLDQSEQSCLLGIQDYRVDNCVYDDRNFKIAWSISTNGRIIAEGNSNQSYSGALGSKMSKILKEFKTLKGEKYTIALEVVRSDKRLAITNPVIKVLIGKSEHKQGYVLSGLSYLLAYALLFLSMLIFIINLIYRRFIK